MPLDIDWDAAWREAHERRGHPDDANRWDERSADYAKSSGKGPYAAAFLERAGIEKGETVLDMGCGSGTLALPLARDGHEVYACDFSRGMLDQLVLQAKEEGVSELVHPILLSWDDDWSHAQLPICDVALASRSIATDDLRGALEKLSSMARRRVCITLTTTLSPRTDPVLLAAAGREAPRYPDAVFAFNMLWGMGVHPEVSYIDSPRTSVFPSFDEAIDRTCAVLKATPEERARLVEYSKVHLRDIGDAETGPCWEYDHVRITSWAFLAWNKRTGD